jgi:hypothetical protein
LLTISIDEFLQGNPRPNCQRSPFPPVHGKTRSSSFNLTKIGSTLSPEEPRLHAWDRSRFSRGISKITDFRYKSKDIRKSFGNFLQEASQESPAARLANAGTARPFDISGLLVLTNFQIKHCGK